MSSHSRLTWKTTLGFWPANSMRPISSSVFQSSWRSLRMRGHMNLASEIRWPLHQQQARSTPCKAWTGFAHTMLCTWIHALKVQPPK